MASPSSWKSGPSPPIPRPRGLSAGSSKDRGHKDSNSHYRETVISMVSMLSCSDQANAQQALLAMTNSPESCQALRKAGCIPLLIQILHPPNLPQTVQPNPETKSRAARALKNIVQFNSDDKVKRKEMRVLKLLEAIRSYTEYLKTKGADVSVDCEKYPHPVPCSTSLMKLSFDGEHRNTMCLLGAIHSLADLIQTDHSFHGINSNTDCIFIRRYSGMTLTNLTFGDGTNKALLCSMKEFMMALVAQLESPNEDLRQVTASVLRNLSWNADSSSRTALMESNAVKLLMTAAIRTEKDSPLKASLSALWNLSSHCAANKHAICQTDQAIEYLVSLLDHNSKPVSIVENAGGILRNISTVICTDEALRQEFRSYGIFTILLEHLKSSSLTVVSNACGMLWHLSTNCEEDQRTLIDLGAIPKLKALMYSKHDRIAQGATSAFRNLSSYFANESPPTPVALPRPIPIPAENSPQQQPMDLRTSIEESSPNPSKTPKSLPFSDEPLDLSLHSTKSTPVHVVSAAEFGSHRQLKTPAFLNPPLQTNTTQKYYSPKNYNSCPEFMRFVQPAHQATPIDFSKSEATVEDTTTDYSLHFTESEDLPTTKNEDTVKTYYCEGTPLNFSTSNSMSDLTQVEKPVKLKPIIESGSNAEDQTRKYCTEHTPATFSRASSLSSIASNIQGGENTAEYLEETPPKLVNGTNGTGGAGKEKVKRNVTFSANETPLMFSRSSSVNSLDSMDINYEDTGSVASEFSRRASEVVSPSELPDSPRQITPAFPLSFEKKERVQETSSNKDEDTVKVFSKSGESAVASGMQSVRSLSPLTIDGETVGVDMRMDFPTDSKRSTTAPVSTPKTIPSSSASQGSGRHDETDEPKVFEGIEGTPFGISTATSLSDLMSELDIDEKPESDPAAPVKVEESPPTSSISPQTANHTDSASPPAPSKSQEEPEPIYTDAQMLAKCINAGRAARLPKSKSEFSKLNTKTVKMSASYHDELKKETEIDADLAALIQMGKNRVRGNRGISVVVPPKYPARTIEPRDLPKSIVANKVKKPPLPPPTEEICEKADLGTEKTDLNSKSVNSNLSPKRDPSSSTPVNQQSIISIGSEWNEDTCSLSIPSLSINTAFRMAESTSTKADTSKTGSGPKEDPNNIMLQSTLSNVQPPSEHSALVSSTGCWLPKASVPASEESNLFNQKPPPELDMENSMMSVASLKSEVASIGGIEEGMHDMSLGGETYTIGGGSDATDAEDSINEDTASMSEVREMVPMTNQERFLTFTAKRHSSSPRQKRRDDPGRYLTRTISPHTPHDTNRNPSPSSFSTFKVDRSPKVNRPLAATSNDSSPASSPRGIRGRRKQLYASLPPQPRKSGPPIPPKPKPVNNSIFVRPTRTSELRAAGSRDISPKQSKSSSKNSSTNSLNSMPLPQTRRTPPKPPVRTSASAKSYAVVRAVRNSNSSIGFTEEKANEIGFNTLPRPVRVSEAAKETNKVGKLSNFWNQLTSSKSKTDNSGKQSNSGTELNGNHPTLFGNVKEKKSKFGFHSFGIGKKKKDNVSLKSEDEGPCHVQPVPKGKATVAPFNYNNANTPATVVVKSESNSGSSKMTTV